MNQLINFFSSPSNKYEILDNIKLYGPQYLNNIETTCIDFYSFQIRDIIIKIGLTSLPKMKNLGLLDKLDGYDITEIIIELGLESIPALSEFQLLDVLNGYHVAKIVNKFGVSSLSQLEKVDLLEKIDNFNVAHIINELGLGILPELKKWNVYKKIDKYTISSVINQLGLTALPTLKDFGLIKKLNSSTIELLVKKHGVQTIYLLHDAGVDFSIYNGTFNQSFLTIISEKEKVKAAKALLEVGVKLLSLVPMIREHHDISWIDDEFLNLRDSDGFALAYHLWQSNISLDKKYFIKSKIGNLNKYMPVQYNVITECLYSFYYHKNINDTKTALVLQGPDHNEVLEYPIPHIFYQKGYNVIAIDGRNIDKNITFNNITSTSLKQFLNNNNISISTTLDIVYIGAHGKYEGGDHWVSIPYMNEIKPNEFTIVKAIATTNILVKNLVTAINLQSPIKIIITSCYGWSAVSKTINHLPDQSEIIAFSKYRVKNNIEEVQSNNKFSAMRFSIALKDNNKKLDTNNVNVISGKEIALLHELNGSGKSIYSGSTLYAKKNHNHDTTIICEDEALKTKQQTYEIATIHSFSKAVCYEEVQCQKYYNQSLYPISLEYHKNFCINEFIPIIEQYKETILNAFACYVAFSEL